MKIEPLFDRVLLKTIKSESKTTISGLVLPESAQEKPFFAEVIAVGPGKKAKDEEEMAVDIGDKVLYSKYAGVECKIDNQELIIIKQTDILAKISKEK